MKDNNERWECQGKKENYHIVPQIVRLQ